MTYPIDQKSRIYDFVVKSIFTVDEWIDEGEQNVPRYAMLRFLEYGFAIWTLRETEQMTYWGLPSNYQGWLLFNKFHRVVQLSLHHDSEDYSSKTAEELDEIFAEYRQLLTDLEISHTHSKLLKRSNPHRWITGIVDTCDEYVATQELRYEAQRKLERL